MKSKKGLFVVVSLLPAMVLLLSIARLNARDDEIASRTFAIAQTVKPQCLNTCRARYRDCRRLRQLPSFECRNVYSDCARSCTGSGPG